MDEALRDDADEAGVGRFPQGHDIPERIVCLEIPLLIGRAQGSDVRLDHPSISRKHATLERKGPDHWVTDHDSRFGTHVNGHRIRIQKLSVDDLVQFGTAASYRVEQGGLVLCRNEHGIGVAVHDLAFHRDDHCIFRGLTFTVKPDEFVGLLGPSGAGKSSLLNCLATYLEPSQGTVAFDGVASSGISPKSLREYMGYVPQADLVYRELTVAENLRLAAGLRLPELGQAVILERTGRVLDQIELTEHADISARNLSGGQRKRLSVGIELLRQPRLLMLDEPTSGLDPATEARFMERMRMLAGRGTTVICTTHMLDSIRLFDRVLALDARPDGARIAYDGPPAQLLDRFQCRNFADLYDRLSKPERFVSLGEADQQVLTDRAAVEAAQPPTGELQAAEDRIAADQTADLKICHRQVWLVLERTARQVWSDRKLVLTLLLQPVGLGLLNCISQYAATSAVPLLFCMVIIALWLGLNNCARELIRERRLYMRDRLAGLLPHSYLAAKALFHAATGFVQIGLLVAFVELLSWIRTGRSLGIQLLDTPVAWLFFVLYITYLCSVALGLLISIIAETEEAAIAVLPLLIMPQLLVSAVGTGQVQEVFHLQKPAPFRPIAVQILNCFRMSPADVIVDLGSLPSPSRPAILLLREPHAARSLSLWWLVELGHLVLLTLVYSCAAVTAFQKCEPRWRALIATG